MKDNRVIKTSVRLPAQLNERRQPVGTSQEFHAGQEDELQAAATPAQLAYLQKQNAIEGDWAPAKANNTKTEVAKAEGAKTSK